MRAVTFQAPDEVLVEEVAEPELQHPQDPIGRSYRQARQGGGVGDRAAESSPRRNSSEGVAGLCGVACLCEVADLQDREL